MNKRLKGIIFDLDGVIADTEDVHRQAYNRMFDEEGLGVEWSPADYRARLAQTAGSKLNDIELSEASDPEKVRERMYRRKREIYLELLQTLKLPPRPGVRELIGEARKRGISIGAASTCAKEGAEAILRNSLGDELFEAFQVVKAGEDAQRRKPEPDIYLTALEGLGLQADEAVAIEDTVHGLQSAKAAGLWTVVTPSQYTLGDDFSQADWVVRNLEEGGVNVESLNHRLAGTDPTD